MAQVGIRIRIIPNNGAGMDSVNNYFNACIWLSLVDALRNSGISPDMTLGRLFILAGLFINNEYGQKEIFGNMNSMYDTYLDSDKVYKTFIGIPAYTMNDKLQGVQIMSQHHALENYLRKNNIKLFIFKTIPGNNEYVTDVPTIINRYGVNIITIANHGLGHFSYIDRIYGLPRLLKPQGNIPDTHPAFQYTLFNNIGTLKGNDSVIVY